jgi:AcrR family transcriptional regulator
MTPSEGRPKSPESSTRAQKKALEARERAEREARKKALDERERADRAEKKSALEARKLAEREAQKKSLEEKKSARTASKLAERTRRDADRDAKAAATRARKTRLPALERRAQLVAVGRAVFAEHGYEATSVEEIAARANVSKPIVYEHFGGKEGLYAVVVDREMDYVVRRIAEAIGEGSPRERVERASLAFLAYVRDDPDGFAVLSQDSPITSGGGRMSSLLNDLAQRVGHVFVRNLEDAGYDAKAAPIYAHALVGMVTFVGRWWTGVRKPPIEEVARHMSALAWMGLRHLPKKPNLRVRP